MNSGNSCLSQSNEIDDMPIVAPETAGCPLHVLHTERPAHNTFDQLVGMMLKLEIDLYESGRLEWHRN